MGGSIAVVCRKPDGSVHSLYRWTNPLPSFVHDARFLSKDEEYLQAYIDEPPVWHEDDPDFHWPILPSEYGIVLLDWQNNKIIAANGYTSFGWGYSFEFLYPNNVLPSPEKENRESFAQGKIIGVDNYIGTEGFSTEGMSYEEFIEALREFENKPKRPMSRILYDMSPFEVVNLSDREEDFRKVKELIEAEGIEVDPSWDEHLAERYADC